MTDPSIATQSLSPKSSGKGRWVMLLVTACFVLPIVVAYALAFGWLPGAGAAGVNRGVLLKPGLDLRDQASLETAALRRYGEWNIVLLTSADCAPPCGTDRASVSRFRQALGIEQERVAVVRLLDVTAEDEPGVQQLASSLGPVDDWSARFGAGLVDVLVVDFQGRPVLAYPRPAILADVLKDLRRLLRASKTP